jgi:hypothetical protein
MTRGQINRIGRKGHWRRWLWVTCVLILVSSRWSVWRSGLFLYDLRSRQSDLRFREVGDPVGCQQTAEPLPVGGFLIYLRGAVVRDEAGGLYVVRTDVGEYVVCVRSDSHLLDMIEQDLAALKCRPLTFMDYVLLSGRDLDAARSQALLRTIMVQAGTTTVWYYEAGKRQVMIQIQRGRPVAAVRVPDSELGLLIYGSTAREGSDPEESARALLCMAQTIVRSPRDVR